MKVIIDSVEKLRTTAENFQQGYELLDRNDCARVKTRRIVLKELVEMKFPTFLQLSTTQLQDYCYDLSVLAAQQYQLDATLVRELLMSNKSAWKCIYCADCAYSFRCYRYS